MYNFHSPDVVDLLGVSSLTKITPEDIWTHLVTPQVRALLGEIESCHVSVRDTVAGDFPGDEVFNLNGHLLDGVDKDRVRFPYVNVHYKTTYGAFVVKYDALKFKASGWWGDMRKPQLIFKAALRDRRFDGTRRANDNSLIEFAGCYDHPANAPLKLPEIPVDVRCVEASVYAFMPGSRIVDACGDAKLDHFVENPFRYLGDPKEFLRLFNLAWNTSRSPGQNGNPIPDFSRLVINSMDKLAQKAGYDFIENSSSHYHVARWTEANGYHYTTPEHKALLKQFEDGIKRIKAAGHKLTRQQESWVCVVQSLPDEFIPAHLNLHGPKWPQDNISPYNLWMYKPVSDRAKAVHNAFEASLKLAAEEAARAKQSK
jgi:hypothetical protein